MCSFPLCNSSIPFYGQPLFRADPEAGHKKDLWCQQRHTRSEAQIYQVWAYFKALTVGILMAPLKTTERFFCISSSPAGLCLVYVCAFNFTMAVIWMLFSRDIAIFSIESRHLLILGSRFQQCAKNKENKYKYVFKATVNRFGLIRINCFGLFTD